MPLAPDARAGHEDETADCDADEVPAGEEGDFVECSLVFEGEGDGCCGEEGRERGDYDAEHREDEEHEVALP